MANLAVFASGRGTNFAAIEEYLRSTPHRLRVLVSDKPLCGAVGYAESKSIPVIHAAYEGASRRAVERELVRELREASVHAIALAGFMRVLTEVLIDAFPDRILNLHPSLLPAYPGLNAIRRSFDAMGPLGITIHRVDTGIDTGPIVAQHEVPRSDAMTAEAAETAVHEAEHYYYPRTVAELLDAVDRGETVPAKGN